jgi:hypothetical protein
VTSTGESALLSVGVAKATTKRIKQTARAIAIFFLGFFVINLMISITRHITMPSKLPRPINAIL